MTTIIRQTIEAPTQQTVNHSLRKPNYHPDLTGRDVDDQHPISAITGLQDALDLKLQYALVITDYTGD